MAVKKDLGLKKRLNDTDKEGRATLIDGLPYQVGFAKPPIETRFKPGNKQGRGRAKGSKNLRDIIREEFDAEIEVTENGKARKMSKKQVLVRQVANKASGGDAKAATMSFDLMRRVGEFGEGVTVEAPALDARDFEAVRSLAAFLGCGLTQKVSA